MDTEHYQITGSRGDTYTITVANGVAVACTCKGYTYRYGCRHLREALEQQLREAQSYDRA